MSQWFATSKNFKKQKKVFTTLVKNQSFDASIKKLSQDINSIIQSPIFMDLFFTEILWIGSQARIDPSKNGPIVSLFINESLQLCDEFESSDCLFAEDYRVRLNTNIAITIELLKELNRERAVSIIGCLTNDEIDRVDELLDDYESIPLSDTTININTSTQVQLLDKLNHCPSIEKISSQIEMLLDIATGENEFSSKALAALNYILQEDDAVPDFTGLLGLVDDFYAIQIGLQESQHQTKLLKLVSFHNAQYPSFKLPPFSANNKLVHLTNIERIIKASYTNLTKDTEQPIKRVILLPDMGPIPLLACLGKALCNRSDSSKENIRTIKNFNSGEYLSLGSMNMQGRYVKGKFKAGAYEKGKFVGHKQVSKEIIVQYLGLHDRVPSAHLIRTKKGKESLSSSFIKNATLIHSIEAPILSTTYEVHNFKNYDEEISPWRTLHFSDQISSIAANKSIFLFTQKIDFDIHSDEKIYGKALKDILGFRYVTRNFNFKDHYSNEMIFPKPILYICSDPDIAIEMLNKRWPKNSGDHDEPMLIILDGDRFSDNELLLNELKHHNADAVIFKEYFRRKSDQLSQAPFEIIPIKPDYFLDIKFDRANSPIERFLNRSQPLKIKYEKTLNRFGQDFGNLLKEIRFQEEESFFKMELTSLKNTFMENITRRDVNAKAELAKKSISLLEDLELRSDFDRSYEALYKFFKLNFDGLMLQNKEEELKHLLENKVLGELNTIIVSPMHRKALSKFIQKNSLDARVISFRELQTDKQPIDNLIIPSRLTVKNGQKLRNYRYAKNHIFLGSAEEIELSKLWVERDARSFENIYGISDFKVITRKQEEDLDAFIQEVDPIEEMLSASSAYIQKNFISQENANHNIDSVLMVLPDKKLIILPEQGKFLVQKTETHNEVDLLPVRDITIGGTVLTTNNNLSGEMLLDFILQGDDDAYEQYKIIEAQAKSWKKVLINFKQENNYSLENLVDQLAKFDVPRNQLTVKYWLEEAFTIAPKFNNDIENIFRMVGLQGSERYDKCIESIAKLHELTSEARKKLVAIINGQIEKSNDGELIVKIGSTNITFQQQQVESTSKIVVDRKYLYQIMSFDQLFKNNKPNE